MAEQAYRVGERVEVNIAGLAPVAATEVLLDLDARGEWHPAEIAEVLGGGAYTVHITPLIGSIEIPPVDASRLRRR